MRAPRPGVEDPAARAVHGQRGDDRVGGALSRAGPVSWVPRVRRLRAQRRLTRRDRLRGRPNRSMPTLTLYTKPDCTLCDEAQAALERVRMRMPFELEVVDISADARAGGALRGADPGRARRRRRGCGVRGRRKRTGAPPRRRRGSCAMTRRRRGRRPARRAAREPGRRPRHEAVRRPAVARRGGAPLALPAGPDAGAEDGQGHDLVAGAVRLHPHQLDPDPARPVGLRQVRQARRRIQRGLARLADPQDPADVGPAQHRAVRRRQPRPGDRQLRHLCRPRIPRRVDLRRRPTPDRQEGRDPRGARLRHHARRRRGRGHRRRGAGGAGSRRRSAWRTTWSKPA